MVTTKTFTFDGKWKIRVSTDEKDIWFCAKDVADAIRDRRTQNFTAYFTRFRDEERSARVGDLFPSGEIGEEYFSASTLLWDLSTVAKIAKKAEEYLPKYPNSSKLLFWLEKEFSSRSEEPVTQQIEDRSMFQANSIGDSKDVIEVEFSETDISVPALVDSNEPEEVISNRQVFVFDGKEITAVTHQREPWFLGSQITNALEYANGPKAIRTHVNEEDTKILPCQIQTEKRVISTKTLFINESGLYSLIFSSKNAKAGEFKRWVTKEVLPAIRQYGVYGIEKLLGDPDFAIQIFTALKEEQERNKVLQAKVNEYKSKAEYCDRVLNAEGAMSATVIASEFGMTVYEFNDILHSLNIIYSTGKGKQKHWVLYRDYLDKGYTKLFTYQNGYDPSSVGYVMKWTQKGRRFIHNLFAENGIMPA